MGMDRRAKAAQELMEATAAFNRAALKCRELEMNVITASCCDWGDFMNDPTDPTYVYLEHIGYSAPEVVYHHRSEAEDAA